VAPVLVFGGATDGIAPLKAVKPVVSLLTGSAEVRFEIVPGGHLGMLTGRAARESTWRVMDEWVEKWSSQEPAPSARKTTTKKAASKKSAAKKASTKKTTAKKAATKKSAAKKATPTKAVTKKAPAKKAATKRTATKKTARPDAIGVNPVRRYGSAGSRSLGSSRD
jgi:polyhydroxyalkanoate synthase